MSEDEELPQFAWYWRGNLPGHECILVDVGEGEARLDIRDAVFLRHQLDNAIRDYDKGAGR